MSLKRCVHFVYTSHELYVATYIPQD
uniref:Uncharacterized protein n=1 Tax=Anguilla anguilla TaxID=7936 RepID=A0A0E9UAX9_ANGAN